MLLSDLCFAYCFLSSYSLYVYIFFVYVSTSCYGFLMYLTFNMNIIICLTNNITIILRTKSNCHGNHRLNTAMTSVCFEQNPNIKTWSVVEMKKIKKKQNRNK